VDKRREAKKEKRPSEGRIYLKEYPHALTKKCGKCGREFTCKGTGWTRLKSTKKCPYEYSVCWCGECNHERPRGCEEIPLKEIVSFT
jgi:hypothetical protein